MMKIYSAVPNSFDEQAKAESKYQILLEDFVELQKDLVSTKRILQKKKQDREILLAEVRFLRQRHEYLTMLQSQKPEIALDSVQQQFPKIEAKEKSSGAAKKTKKKSLIPDLNSSLVEGADDMAQETLRTGKKRKGSISSKGIGKKKLSWQDPVALKVV